MVVTPNTDAAGACETCGAPLQQPRRGRRRRFCPACRSARDQAGELRREERRKSTRSTEAQRARWRAQAKARYDSGSGTKARVVLEPRACAECGVVFEPANGNQTTYCCAAHRRRAVSRDKRYRELTGDPLAAVSRAAVLLRDEWTCQLCRQPIDPSLASNAPDGAVLQHVVPPARGGRHSTANVRSAHRHCAAKANPIGG